MESSDEYERKNASRHKMNLQTGEIEECFTGIAL